ncbi:hypothetical protein VNI00_008950 [Paramarasmius palmivorus]|uniref:Uncharacterized protein n=1 Tax=Paramarasmius palmivorus TaxID=297713 RepID=A0AAW0CUS2_9AGAR
MQSETLTIAQRLNTLSYAQKQAIRALVEYILLQDATDTVCDILSQTTFMDDLAEFLREQEAAARSNDDEVENEGGVSSECSEEDSVESSGENMSE